MLASLRVPAGLACIWGLTGLVEAADQSQPKPKPSATAGQAKVDVSPTGSKNKSPLAQQKARSNRNVIRGQNPFELADSKVTTANATVEADKKVAENPFEVPEPRVTVNKDVVPPAAPKSLPLPSAPIKPGQSKAAVIKQVGAVTTETDSEALKKLKDRSAKARWEQLHQEWLENKKAQASPPALTPPVAQVKSTPAVIPSETEKPETKPSSTTESDNPFEVLSPIKQTPKSPETSVPPPPPEVSNARQPAPKPVLEVAQPKAEDKPSATPRNPANDADPSVEADGDATPLPPAVRDPADLPKISEILPIPRSKSEVPGRKIPEQDAKRYVRFGHAAYAPRTFTEFYYQYQATNVYSNPLYFEDPHLERYGHTTHGLLQPFVSMGLFSLQVAGLPYQMAINHPNEKVYPLGWYSPGDYVPYQLRQIPISGKGIATEAAVILGTGYLTP